MSFSYILYRRRLTVAATILLVWLYRSRNNENTRYFILLFLNLFNVTDKHRLTYRIFDFFAQSWFYFVGIRPDGHNFQRNRYNILQNLAHVPERLDSPCGVAWKDATIPGEQPSELEPNGIPDHLARVYYRRNDVEDKICRKVPVILFFHGGGFVLGTASQIDYHSRMKKLADYGFVVVSADYRLAPENPFPAAIIDGYRAMKWTVEDENILPPQADKSRIVLMGDSAGGSHTAVLSSLVRDKLDGYLRHCTIQKSFSIVHQVIIYGALFHQPGMPSTEEFDTAPLLSPAVKNFFYDAYMPPEIRDDALKDRRANVWAAGLHNLPNTTVVTAEICPLRDENIKYAQSISKLGGNSSHYHILDDIHGCFTINTLGNADAIMEKVKDDLKYLLPREMKVKD